MYRAILLSLFFSSLLDAMSYQEILQEALKNSATLQVSQRQQKSIALQGEIEIRRKNPNVELEVADFLEIEPKRFGVLNEVGLRVGVSQELLLPNVKKEIEGLTQAKINVAQQEHKLLVGEFIYQFTLKYLSYRNSKKQEHFLEEALRISNEILESVKIRYEHGAEAKSEYLQSRLDARQLLNRIDELRLEISLKRDEFLAFANIPHKIEIDEGYPITLEKSQQKHPFLQLKEREEQLLVAKQKRLSHTIERIELFSEIERDQNEDILRMGIAIPLPLYDNKSQERALVKIEQSNQIDKQQNRASQFKIRLKQLTQRLKEIKNTITHYQARLEEQRQLFGIYQEAYQFAQVKLFKLQESQKNVVKIQESIARLEMQLETNIVKINYLRGVYHE